MSRKACGKLGRKKQMWSRVEHELSIQETALLKHRSWWMFHESWCDHWGCVCSRRKSKRKKRAEEWSDGELNLGSEIWRELPASHPFSHIFFFMLSLSYRNSVHNRKSLISPPTGNGGANKWPMSPQDRPVRETQRVGSVESRGEKMRMRYCLGLWKRYVVLEDLK